MTNKNFYNFFNSVKEKLEIRQSSFAKIFQYLDNIPAPINIVETGCLRIENNFRGDGQSTLLFDKYTQSRGNGSKVYTVDINPNATQICKNIVSENVDIHTGDSVKYLLELMPVLKKTNKKIDLFYLDSFDVDWKSSTRSAAHHLKELTAIINFITEKTLIVVDDAPIFAPMKIENNKINLISGGNAPRPFVSGKGYLISEFAFAHGADVYFSDYQTAWTGFNKKGNFQS